MEGESLYKGMNSPIQIVKVFLLQFGITSFILNYILAT